MSETRILQGILFTKLKDVSLETKKYGRHSQVIYTK